MSRLSEVRDVLQDIAHDIHFLRIWLKVGFPVIPALSRTHMISTVKRCRDVSGLIRLRGSRTMTAVGFERFLGGSVEGM